MKTSLFNNILELMIPEGFVMNENNIRYPYKDKPPVIMTNEDIQTDLTFNRLEKSLTVGEVKAAVKEILFLLEDRKDMERVSDYHFFRGENVSGYWIFFINRGVYGNRYNCMTVFPTRNKFTMITMGTYYENRRVGKNVFKEVITTIRDKTRSF